MIILIIGYDQSGKTSFATYLGAELGAGVANTGDVLIEELRGEMANQHSEISDEEFKLLFRQQLRDLGDRMTQKEPGILFWKATDLIGAEDKIITGVRRKLEFNSIRGYCDYVFWIDRNGAEKGNCDINPDIILTHISNNNGLENLRNSAKLLANEIKKDENFSFITT